MWTPVYIGMYPHFRFSYISFLVKFRWKLNLDGNILVSVYSVINTRRLYELKMCINSCTIPVDFLCAFFFSFGLVKRS